MDHPLKSSVDDEYDIVIAGGGTAGCVLAGRLAATAASLKILVLEAGPETKDDLAHIQPARFLPHLLPTSTTVRFHIEPPSETLAGRPLVVPTAQCLGGGSSVNFLVYTRPSASDYDAWETTYNNPGWGSNDLLPLLKKTETFQAKPNALNHGYHGPLKVSFGGYFTNVGRQFLDSASQFDPTRPLSDDTNDLVTVNVYARYAKWIDAETGKRSDVPHHYIYNQTNPGLHVVTGVHVKRVLIENMRAVGVEFKWNHRFLPDADDAVHTVRAKRLVVVSAGAFGSPGILERSGIGGKSILEPLGIKVEEDLPGVGENYQANADHNAVFPVYYAAPEAETIDGIIRNDPVVIAEMSRQWNEDGSGLMAHNGIDGAAKIRPSEQELKEIGPEFWKIWDEDYAHLPDKPVILFAVMALFSGDASSAPVRKYFSTVICNLYALARGHVHVTDAHDATAALDFKSGFLESVADIKPLVWAYKLVREICRRMALFRGEYAPQHPVFPPGSRAAVVEDGMPTPIDAPKIVYTEEDDLAIELYLRKNIATAWHFMGTCAMKPREDEGVVDSKLNVHGIQGLKVAELFTMIFGLLEYTDILRCSMVCKHFKNVTEGSMKLKWIVKLGMDGLVDCYQELPSTTSDRWNALLDHQSRWRSLNWLKSERLSAGETFTGILDFSSGILVQLEFPDLEDHDFSEVHLKCTSLNEDGKEEDGKPATQRTHANGCITGVCPDGERFQVEHVLVQPLANLIALVDCKQILRLEYPGADDEEAEVQAMAIRIHLRSLSSGGREPHPLSDLPVIEHGVELITPNEMVVYKASVDWDLISVIISNTPGKEFVVWNYLTGERLVHIRPRPLSIRQTHDFSLVTPTSFIAVSSIMTPHGTWIDIVELFAIDPVANVKSRETTDGVTLVARLCLPQRLRGAQIAMDVTAGRFSPTSPSHTCREMFTTASESHVYAIRVRRLFDDSTADPGPKLGLVIHRDTFISILKRSEKEPPRKKLVPWEQWGPQNTRCFQVASSCERCPRFVVPHLVQVVTVDSPFFASRFVHGHGLQQPAAAGRWGKHVSRQLASGRPKIAICDPAVMRVPPGMALSLAMNIPSTRKAYFEFETGCAKAYHDHLQGSSKPGIHCRPVEKHSAFGAQKRYNPVA
ncbi:hypothetical protein EVG20_g6684 [Dentipellis fragilis]|uniref:Glucose-methanol-choline oxidoreductase N-terminal domain-containing protein n=1 Tax=Dentipellis fragilis TaxID=205917 RepID=A0A4Y9YJE3_9AGAM|nr:hypothetical protein EVG20_g6684 [Dentipellis fragilis]